MHEQLRALYKKILIAKRFSLKVWLLLIFFKPPNVNETYRHGMWQAIELLESDISNDVMLNATYQLIRTFDMIYLLFFE